LLDLALEFSPLLERTPPDTIVFSIDALRKLIGSPHQIASEICRCGYERKLRAHLAIAANPDTAILLAHYFAGVTLVTPGEERFHTASIPLSFLHELAPQSLNILDSFERWGLKTCEDLAALPEKGVAERLGAPGVYWRNLALGKIHRPLRISAPETCYQERMELEYALDLLEPLLFLLDRVLCELCSRLRSQSLAARQLEATLTLDAPGSRDPGAGRQAAEYRCKLEFPIPLQESATMLKLLQLHLERHSPGAPITAFSLRIDPIEPRLLQEGLFLPPTPPAGKLQITMARIAAMVGDENIGTPLLRNTHRPDAFQLASLCTEPSFQSAKGAAARHQSVEELASPSGGALDTVPVLRECLQSESPGNENVLRLAMRLFRPALKARVKLVQYAPKKIDAPGVAGNIVRSAGPWRTSGEWWTPKPWNREEWDVALEDGSLYRIYCEIPACDWFVCGIYD
jgi:protein ImuB